MQLQGRGVSVWRKHRGREDEIISGKQIMEDMGQKRGGYLDFMTDLVDMGQIPFGNHITHGKDKFYTTPRSVIISFVIRCCIVMYVCVALWQWLTEYYVQVISDVETRSGLQRSPSDIMEKLEFKFTETMLPGGSFHDKWIMSLGATFEITERNITLLQESQGLFNTTHHAIHDIKFHTNCSGFHHNFPNNNTDLHNLAAFISRLLQHNDRCKWGEENIAGDANTVAILFIKSNCLVDRSDSFVTTISNHIPSPNHFGQSQYYADDLWYNTYSTLYTQRYVLSTVRTKRGSKWYPFVGMKYDEYYYSDPPTEIAQDYATTLRAWDGEAFLLAYPHACGVLMYVDLENVIYIQEVWPETILGLSVRIGGVIAFFGIFATLLKMYNSNALGERLAGVDLRDLEDFVNEQKKVAEEHKELLGEALDLTNKTRVELEDLDRKQQQDAIRELKKPPESKKSHPHIYVGQVLYNKEWLPAEVFDDTRVIVARIKGNLELPDAKGLILDGLSSEDVRKAAVQTFAGKLRPDYGLSEAIKRSPIREVCVTVVGLKKEEQKKMNGAQGVAVGFKRIRGRKWFIVVIGNEEKFFREKNLQLDDWIDAELELLPEGKFRGRDLETGRLYKNLTAGDVRVERPTAKSLAILPESLQSHDFAGEGIELTASNGSNLLPDLNPNLPVLQVSKRGPQTRGVGFADDIKEVVF